MTVFFKKMLDKLEGKLLLRDDDDNDDDELSSPLAPGGHSCPSGVM